MDQEGQNLLDSFFYENIQNPLALRENQCFDISFLSLGASEAENYQIEDSTYGINDLFGARVQQYDAKINAEKEYVQQKAQIKRQPSKQSVILVKMQPGLQMPKKAVVSYPQRKHSLAQMKYLSKVIWMVMLKRRKVSLNELVDKIIESDRYSVANLNMENYERKAYNNLKRRIYDAINVFSSIGLVYRNRKELSLIRGQGIHNNKFCQFKQEQNNSARDDLKKLKRQYESKLARLRKLKQMKKEALERCQLVRNLIARNMLYTNKMNKHEISTQKDKKSQNLDHGQENIIRFPIFGLVTKQMIEVEEYPQKVRILLNHTNISVFSDSQTLFYIPSIQSCNIRKQLNDNGYNS